MRIGVTVPLSDDDTPDRHTPTFDETLGFALRAEALGLDSIWVYDHFFFRSDGAPDVGVREAWTTFAALAARVPRVELGTLVLCAAFRNPGLTARMAAAADDLSGGRTILGLGSGWHDPEYLAFGYPTDHRVGRFAEDLEIVARLLRGERVTIDGRWRSMADAVLAPPPGRHVPVLVAGRAARMLGLTARWADAWNNAWFGRIDDRFRDRLAGLEAACAAIGRDPASIRRTIGIRLLDPGAGTPGPTMLDADASGLADFLDEVAAFGIDDAIIWSISKSMAALERIGEARAVHRARAGRSGWGPSATMRG